MPHKPDVKSANKLRETLDALGLSQAELARVAEVKPTTVNRWATAKRPIPGLLWAYLELRRQVRELAHKSGVLE
jgi:transcriptional regulator with XRE-family HTH domain